MITILKRISNIPGYPGYYADVDGTIYSDRKGDLKPLCTYTTKTSNYKQLVISYNNKRQHCLVHRLVALTFIPNPNNLPEVNHKDKNTLNNNVDNLEWCTRKDNLNYSYSTLSPNRNYRTAKLYCNNVLLGEFKGIKRAAKYAQQKYNVNASSLEKYLKCGPYYIQADTNGKYFQKTQLNRMINRNPIKLYKNGYYQKTFKTCVELLSYMRDDLNIKVCVETLRKYINQQKPYNNYTFKRDEQKV